MTVGKGIMSKADTIAETLKQYREKDGTLPPALQEVERKFNPDGNPLLIVWKIKCQIRSGRL